MQSKTLGRAAAAAGLMALLLPSAAFASWWDGGYDGRYDSGYNERRENRSTTSTTSYRAAPGYEQPPESATSPGYESPGETPPPDCGQSDCAASPPQSPCDQPSPCGPPPGPPPPPPPPAGFFGPVYGCENSDLSDTRFILHKTTAPPPGTPVLPGDEIVVEITWLPYDWSGPDLHKAIDCVYINGLLVPELSGGERPTPNDGHFAWHYFVPLDVPPGSEICDQGFVSGPDGWEDYGRAVSNLVCFPVDVPPPPPQPAPSCCTGPPEASEEPTTTTVPEEEAEPYAESVRYEQEAPPPPTVLPEQRDVLPRTGGDSAPARLAAGALALALAAGRMRRGRRG